MPPAARNHNSVQPSPASPSTTPTTPTTTQHPALQLRSFQPAVGRRSAVHLLTSISSPLPPNTLPSLRILSLTGNRLDDAAPWSSLAVLASSLESLRLAQNRLTSLPPVIASLSCLQRLDISENEVALLSTAQLPASLTELQAALNQMHSLTVVPTNDVSLPQLSSLSLSLNPLSNVSGIAHLSKLEQLDLSHAQLTSVADMCLAQHHRLVNLKLVGNSLTFLPLADLQWLPLLEDLDVAFNRIDSWGSGQDGEELLHKEEEEEEEEAGGAVRWPALRRLSLRHNSFSRVPASLLRAPCLREVHLSGNPTLRRINALTAAPVLEKLFAWKCALDELPDPLPTSLVVLDVAHNHLVALPESIRDCTALRSLTASHNQLRSLPDALTWCSSLGELNLSHNQLDSLPYSMGMLAPSLVVLSVAQNNLRLLPQSVSQLGCLVKLDASFNRLMGLPPWLGSLTMLQELVLAGNPIRQVRQVPPEWTTMRSLRTLVLSYCSLHQEWPQELDASLPALTQVVLDGNSLFRVPDTVFSFADSLRILHASNNSISELDPVAVGSMQSLEVLHLGANMLTTLPDTLFTLHSLQQLNLSQNRLASLSPDLVQLVNLVDLDVSGNVLTKLPKGLSSLRRLSVVNASGNLGFVPDSVAPQAHVVCSYIRTRSVQDKLARASARVVAEQNLEMSQLQARTVARETWALSAAFVGWAEMQGRRPNQEDALAIIPNFRSSSLEAFYGVFDGHAGAETAHFCAAHLSELFAMSLAGLESDKVPTAAALEAQSASLVDARPRLSAQRSSSRIALALSKSTGHLRASSLPPPGAKLEASRSRSSRSSSGSPGPSTSPRSLSHSGGERTLSDSPRSSYTGWTAVDMDPATPIASTVSSASSSPSPNPGSHLAAAGASLASALSTIVSRASTPSSTPRYGGGVAEGADQHHHGSPHPRPTSPSSRLSFFSGSRFTSSPTRVRQRSLSGSPVASLDTPSPGTSVSPSDAHHLIFSSDGLDSDRDGETSTSLTSSAASSASTASSSSSSSAISASSNKGRFRSRFHRSSSFEALSLAVSAPAGLAAGASSHGEGQLPHRKGSGGSFGTGSRVLSLESVQIAFEAAFEAATMRVETSGFESGATAVVGYVVGDVVYLAHAGDARALLVSATDVLLETKDHKPESPEENERIVASGGYVSDTGRVNGTLGVARAIGDCAQQPSITCKPDVVRYDTRGEPVALVLACDGVFDVMSNEQVAEIVRAEAVPHRAAVQVRDVAYALGSSDNISVVVVHLNNFVRPSLTARAATPSIPTPSLSVDDSAWSTDPSPPSSPTPRTRRRRTRRRSVLSESAPSLAQSPARARGSSLSLAPLSVSPGSPTSSVVRRRRKKGRSRTDAEAVRTDGH